MKRLALGIAAALTACAAFAQAPAADWPTKMVKIVVGYPAGGPNDVIARAIAQKVNAATGQPVIVDNRPGASGTIGSDYVAKSAPDGSTLVMNATTHSMVNALYEKLPFDADKDFTPITLVGESTLVLIVRNDQPAKNLAELLATARSQPGRVSFGSTGAGSSPHLAGEMLRQLSKADITHVPYKGSAPAMIDLLGGQITLMFEPLPSALPQIKAGKLRALGVTGTKRLASAPDLPTIAETVPGYEVLSWYGLHVPKGTPPAIVNRLHRELSTIVRKPEISERLAGLGIEPEGNSPDEFLAQIKAEIAAWGKVITAAKLPKE